MLEMKFSKTFKATTIGAYLKARSPQVFGSKLLKWTKWKVFRCLLTLIVPILEKQSVEKIEKLQQCMFKTLSDGFQSILDEENQILLDTER